MPPQLAVIGIWKNTQQGVINVRGFFSCPWMQNVWERGKMKLFLDECNIDLEERGFKSQHLSWLTFLYLLLSKRTLGLCG